MMIVTLLSLAILHAQAQTTCSSASGGAECVGEGIAAVVSAMSGPKTQVPPAKTNVFTLHCMIAGEKPIDRWPCDDVKIESKASPSKVYRGERIVLSGFSTHDEISVYRVKCPSNKKTVQITLGESAAIQFRENDCSIPKTE